MEPQTTYRLTAGIADNLATALEEEIIFLQLSPGERLIEEDIAARYGVSRSPVRDALRTLEREGLVMREARKGIWVTPMSLRDFDEIYRCRAALEALAAEQAARSEDTALKAQLWQVLEQMRAARAAGDVQQFFLHDIRGSELIYSLADDQTLQRLLKGLEKQAMRYRFVMYSRSQTLVDLSFDDTARVFKAICDGEPAQARDLERSLIEKIWNTMRDDIGAEFGAERS